MYYRLMKCALSAAYALLICLTWQWFWGGLTWGLALSSVLVSGLWLVLTRLQMRHLFRTYFDTLSRLQVLAPVMIGVAVSGLAVLASHSLILRAVAGLEFFFWGYIYMLYRRNRKNYMTQGHGPLPAGCWVNPPAQAIAAGDLILTSGRIANRVHESVGHGEVAIRLKDGTMGAFSSYMKKGTVINPLGWLTSAWLRRGEHYVILRLSEPLADERAKQMTALAEVMWAENESWRARINARRARIINWLPLPRSWRSWLAERTRATGYDWLGLFIGARAGDHWTCIGACLELYRRLGIKTHRYGTGLLGLGTGLFDPIMPVRFLADPAFRLLTDKDREAFEVSQTAA